MASATISAAPPFDATAASTTAAQPRKRRRRAPAAGAADDCFTCSNSGIPCDRRRPYCSQCLNEGKDCGGYKTTLTWGVGVASRGKLRGLSLPIAGTAKVSSPTTSTPRKRSTTSSDASAPPKAKRPATEAPKNARSAGQAFVPPFQQDLQGLGVDMGRASQLGAPTSAPWQGASLHAASMTPHMHHRRPMHPHELNPVSIPMTTSYADPTIPASASSTGGYTNYSFPSPVMYSASSEDTSYASLPTPGHKSPMSLSHIVPNFAEQSQTVWEQSQMKTEHTSTIVDSLYSSGHSGDDIFQHQTISFNDQNGLKTDHTHEEDVDDTVFGNMLGFHNDSSSQYESVFLEDAFSDNSMMLSPFANVSIGKTPRMQYLINYYTEVISPVIVAFDGPNNPYRTHILRLAMESETLQHAIAALSASNLRQRRENNVLVSTGKTLPARRASMAHSALTDRSWQSGVAIMSPEDQAREELLHKSVSIQALNNALADPIRRKDDAILATLLILCLFHICDSGVAKFQTQFAGVKKLLGLRSADLAQSNTNASSTLSKETSWYTRMFTWFDAFTATVNDREGQLQGSHLDISSLSDEEWALENLAGCDGRLFKTIAKLGRLNVLSRNGKVEPASSPERAPVSYPEPFANLDGNGWGGMQSPSSPASMFGLPTSFDMPNRMSSPSGSGYDDPSINPKDTRPQQFWSEWNNTRTALLSWHLSADSPVFSPSTPTSTLPLSLTLDQKADLLNISESFRYSALLYLERLARPAMSSSDPKIQVWVARSLNYIRLVKSDVYLLWPLFITGSECVKKADRQCIRQRCLDIQKDSGFMNNWSTLELLEKVWAKLPEIAGSPRDESSSPTNTSVKSTSPLSTITSDHGSVGKVNNHTGFRWRQVMELGKSEGEYIVV